jgi:hypothetical protein
MKKKATLRVVINEKDTREVLLKIVSLAVSRFQDAMSSKLADLSENIIKGDKTEMKKAFYNVFLSFEEAGSDIQDILPLIENMMELPKQEEQEEQED